MSTKELVEWINRLIDTNELYKFYKSKHFTKVKNEVLREQHFECQHCKAKGKLTIVRPYKKGKKRSGVVHHDRWVRSHPELALSKHYIDKQGIKRKNLIVLCDACHEIEHERFAKKKPLTEERW